ncbi:TPA: hypothetical protein ACRZZI_004965 [Vibrio harveyi]
MANTVITHPHGVARTGAMANVTYNSDGNNMFVPEIWSAKLIEKFYNATVFGAISNTDYEGEIKNKGDKVIIRTRPDITISDYQVGMTLSYEHPESKATELNIDHAKYFAYELKDVDSIQTDLNLMDEWATDASEQMKIAIDTSILMGIKDKAKQTENRGETAGRITKGFDLGITTKPLVLTKKLSATPAAKETEILDFLVNLGTVLDEQNVPENGRWVILPAWAAGMIKKSDLKDASLAGDSTSILRNGRLGMIDRFTIYTSNLLPTGTGAAKLVAGEFAIYAGHNSGITFASQITKMETIRNQTDFGEFVRSLQVYGFEVLKPESLVQAIVKKG